jgi:predicted anti-sigma-YlaC factor YlaD
LKSVGTQPGHCTDWRALASCRLDGELDELQTARLEHHLRACAECRSWTDEVAALAGLLHEPEPVRLTWSFEQRARALRRRLVRGVAVGATAASAAAVAAFAIALPGHGISFFSSTAARVSDLPCVSCTKKQALTPHAAWPPPASAPIHVANPLVERG